MEKLDAVVVGAGLSGLSAAYYMAKAGLGVLVLERGDLPGSKNVTGGRLYLGPLGRMIPELLDGAPLERRVSVERLSILSRDASTGLIHRSRALGEPPLESWTVLRARLDRWLADRAMGAGAMVIPQKRVDGFIYEGGAVAGIRSEGEEIGAHVVVVAEGVLGLLTEQLGLRARLPAAHAAVAVKEVIELPPEVVEARFGLLPGEGAAHLFLGAVTRGHVGGGFLYTNRESVSLGVVVGLEDLLGGASDLALHELTETFKGRPEVAPYLDGGKVVEYSAHLVPEGGFSGLVRPYGDGFLVTGDAAGLALNLGVTVRGMDMALASGLLAARTVIRARHKGDFSQATLCGYEGLLGESFVMRDMRTFKDAPRVLANRRLYGAYPAWVNGMVQSLFAVGDSPKARLSRTILQGLRGGVGVASLLRDLWGMRKI
jgi:electron transfer flavoprotein-quinone oxidoreductase